MMNIKPALLVACSALLGSISANATILSCEDEVLAGLGLTTVQYREVQISPDLVVKMHRAEAVANHGQPAYLNVVYNARSEAAVLALVELFKTVNPNLAAKEIT